MSCLEIVARKDVRLCHGCKAWYCRECYDDHTPCNAVSDVKSGENGDDNTEVATPEEAVDDSKPGVWIIKDQDAIDKQRMPFDFWLHVA
jgi:hypothetical protein